MACPLPHLAVCLAALAVGLGGCQGSPAPSPIHDLAVQVRGTGAALPGTLKVPAGHGPFRAVVLIAGSGPNDRDETVGPNKPLRDIADGLAARGIASLRYDKRTLVYKAQVVRQLATFTAADEYVPDAVAAVDLLRHRPEVDPRRVFIMGHSQGGTLAPRIAAASPAIAGVVLLAAAAAPFGETLVRQSVFLAGVRHQSGPAVDAQLAMVRRWAALVDDPNLSPATPPSELPGMIGPPYWLDLTHHDPVATARALPQPILVLQGERDYQVTVADDLALWERGLTGRTGVTVKRYPRADHLFLDGDGPPDPAEYLVAGHVDPTMISDLADWISAAG